MMGYKTYARMGDTITVGSGDTKVVFRIVKGSPTLDITAPDNLKITHEKSHEKTEVIEKGQQISVEKQRLQAIDKILNNRGTI